MLIFLVELANIGQEIFFRVIVKWKHRNISFDQFSLTNKKDLDTHPSFICCIAKDVTIDQISIGHFLFRHHCFDCSDLIPILCCFFKLHV